MSAAFYLQTVFFSSQNIQSSEALFEAVEQQDLDAVQILLFQYTADELDLNTPNSEGLTPLDISIMTNNVPIAKLLLKAGGKESPHCEYAYLTAMSFKRSVPSVCLKCFIIKEPLNYSWGLQCNLTGVNQLINPVLYKHLTWWCHDITLFGHCSLFALKFTFSSVCQCMIVLLCLLICRFTYEFIKDSLNSHLPRCVRGCNQLWQVVFTKMTYVLSSFDENKIF